jgi:predicted Fe-Mo cluster-binding NifX family protein
MRVVVSSNGTDLDGLFSQQFGRCPMFAFVETESMEVESAVNPAADASGGAGIEAAQFIAESSVDAVITGRIGPNAMNVLRAAGLRVYRFDGGTVRQAVEGLKAGKLELSTDGGGQGPAMSMQAPGGRPEQPVASGGPGKDGEKTRIAFSADFDQGLDSPVSHHFGRCPYYVLVDTEGSEIRDVATVENPFYGNHQPGQVPRFLRQQSADVIVTGGMGRRALAFFQAENVETVTGAQGTVAEALDEYLGGRLAGAEPCRDSTRHGHDRQHDDRHHHEHSHEATAIDEHTDKAEIDRLQKMVEELERRISQRVKHRDPPEEGEAS